MNDELIRINVIRIFGENGYNLFSTLISSCDSITTIEYPFMPNDEFLKLQKIEDVQYIYWLEIIQRAHIAATTSLLRIKRWIEGIIISALNNNIFAFYATMRGFIESAADSFYTLRGIPLTISYEFKTIETALLGKMIAPSDSEALENSLIHFTHARYIKKNEKDHFPESHRTREIRQYLESIDNSQNSQTLNLYSELCEMTHPAANSIFNFLIPEENKIILNKYNETDEVYIDKFLEIYRSTISEIFKISVYSSFITLKIINQLPLTELHTSESYLQLFNNTEIWNKCSENIVKSTELYEQKINKWNKLLNK